MMQALYPAINLLFLFISDLSRLLLTTTNDLPFFFFFFLYLFLGIPYLWLTWRQNKNGKNLDN